jgi:hypothetical protein
MRRAIRLLIPALTVLAVWLAWPYLESDKAQVLRQHQRVLSLAADQKWDAVTASMALEYEDQWSQNRAESVAHAEEILTGFITLDIEWTTAEVTVNDNIAKVRGTAKLAGRGLSPANQYVMDRVNALKEPWVFTWRRDGRGPGGWKLLALRNTELGGPLPEDALKQ